MATLQKKLVLFSVFNLLVVSVVGLVLRIYPFASIPFIDYRNLVHAHSHFAFGGWVIPVLLAVMLEQFPELSRHIQFKHWRNICIAILLSAYGMLLSFPIKGYAAVSISFSTLSIFGCLYMGAMLWKASRFISNSSAHFLRVGIVYLAISTVGPLAIGPIAAMGKTGSPVYFDAIYFYLHFQYNGWFSFALLAILYKIVEKNTVVSHGRLVARLLALACVPTYLLSTLWNHPPGYFYYIGFAAGVLQVIAAYYLVKDFWQLSREKNLVNRLLAITVFFFVMKILLQLISAVPAIADLAYTQRNFIIAYLHMVLLGCISTGAIGAFLKNIHPISPVIKAGLSLFLIAFTTTEIILVLDASGVSIKWGSFNYQHLLVFFSAIFPVAFFQLWFGLRRHYHSHPV